MDGIGLPEKEPTDLKARGAFRRACTLARRFTEAAWLLTPPDEDRRLTAQAVSEVDAAWVALEGSTALAAVAALDVMRSIDLAVTFIRQGREPVAAVKAALEAFTNDWPEYGERISLDTLGEAVDDWARKHRRWKAVLAVVDEAGIPVSAAENPEQALNTLQVTWKRHAKRA